MADIRDISGGKIVGQSNDMAVQAKLNHQLAHEIGSLIEKAREDGMTQGHLVSLLHGFTTAETLRMLKR